MVISEEGIVVQAKDISTRERFNFVVERLDFIGLFIVAITLPFSESLKNIGVMLAFIGFLRKGIKTRHWPTVDLFEVGLLMFALSAFLSALFSNDVFKGMKGANDILRFSIIFLVAETMIDEKDVKRLLESFILSATVAALIGLYTSLMTGRILETHTLGNANYTAMYFGMAGLSAISMLVCSNERKRMEHVGLAASMVILLISVVQTTMRSTLVGFAVFIVLLVMVSKSPRVYLTALLSVILLAAAIFSYEPMKQKFFQTQSLTHGRIAIWQKAVELFLQNPLFGIGPNQFYFSQGETIFDAHSLYLQTLSQMGVMGLLGLILLIVGFMISWVRFRAENFQKAIKYSALGAFSIITVSGVLDTTLHHEHGIAFMLLTGLMFSFKNNA